MKRDFIATAIVESAGNPGNEARMRLLSAVTGQLDDIADGDGILLFPAGYFTAGPQQANTILQSLQQEIGTNLAKTKRNIIVCVGIDGCVQAGLSKDQLAIAVGEEGIKAVGRKFYPTAGEKGKIHLASDHLSKEQGYPRMFSLNTWRYYIAVCYDVFGIKRLLLRNPGVDVVLNCIHNFYRRREGPSGVGLFTRHGLAGAAKQWDCPVFATAVFFNRSIPGGWPSGVYWNQGHKSTKEWGYADNPVKESGSLCHSIAQEKALVKIYSVSDCLGL